MKTYEARLINRLIHSKVNVEMYLASASTAGDDGSQAGTIETDEDRLPRRTEKVE